MLIISVDHIRTDDGELQSFKIELFEITFWVRAIKKYSILFLPNGVAFLKESVE